MAMLCKQAVYVGCVQVAQQLLGSCRWSRTVAGFTDKRCTCLLQCAVSFPGGKKIPADFLQASGYFLKSRT